MALIPDEAIDRMAELSAGAWRLYCFLARCRNQKSGKCCPSTQTSAEAIDVHRRNIFKLRNELTAAGWVRFDGDNATELFGFDSGKNTTGDNATSGNNAPLKGNNATKPAAKTPVAYKEEPAKVNQQIEPAKIGASAADTRSTHVAIQTCRSVAKSYPPKELWDKLIQVLGDKPNTTLLVECRAEWVERGYNRASWKWATEWYATGVPARMVNTPPKKPSNSQVGASPPPVPSVAALLTDAQMAEFIDELIEANDFDGIGEQYDLIVQRGGAKAEWEIACVAYYELHKMEMEK